MLTVNRMIAGGFLLASVLTCSTSATIVVTDGQVHSEATAISGRKGSTSGPFTDNPAPIGGTSGSWSQPATATAGPILPVDDNHPSLPGTRTVATGSALSSLVFTPAPGALSIAVSASATNSFTDLDGGSYLGGASSSFETRFALTEPTPWTLTGTTAFNPQDVTAMFRLAGPFDSYAFLTRANNGPISLGGVLPAGEYLFAGNTSVYEVPASTSGSYGESSTIQATLTLVPEPTSAILLGAATVTLLRTCRSRRHN